MLLLVQDDHVIEALTAHAPQEAFTKGVGARGVEWCPQECDACPSRHPCKERSELTVIVANQEPRCLSIGRCFPELLGDPGIHWMARHRDVDDFSALQLNEKESKERARSVSVPVKKDRLLGRVHRDTCCWTRLNERWNRRLSAMSKATTALLAPTIRGVR
jgi:hypothetical protein